MHTILAGSMQGDKSEQPPRADMTQMPTAAPAVTANCDDVICTEPDERFTVNKRV